MTFWWACQSHWHPLNQRDESRNDKHPRQAHQGPEPFSGKPQEAPFAWSRVRELQEWGWNCLQPMFLLPHSEGETVAKRHQKSQDEDNRERLSLWIHLLEASLQLLFPAVLNTSQQVSFPPLSMKGAIDNWLLEPNIIRNLFPEEHMWRETNTCGEGLERGLRSCQL